MAKNSNEVERISSKVFDWGVESVYSAKWLMDSNFNTCAKFCLEFD